MRPTGEGLGLLAAGLCREAGIRLAVAKGPWSWNSATRVLTVSEETLVTHGEAAVAGLLSVEVGRAEVSRHHLFDVSFPLPAALLPLLDALDRERAANWMRQRFVGVTPWIAESAVAAPAFDPSAPAFVQLVHALAWGRPQGLHDAAANVLRQTAAARREYASLLPPEFAEPDRDAADRYRHEVAPRVEGPSWMPGWREMHTRVAAYDALCLAEEEILPAAAALLEADRDAIMAWLAQRADRVARARRADATEARRMVRDACCSGAAGAAAWYREHADALLAKALSSGMGEALVRVARRGPPGGDGTGRVPELPPLEIPWRQAGNYQVRYAKVASQVDALVKHLARILQPRRRLSQRAGYPSGRRVDMRRLVQFEADPRRYDTLWVRSTIPDRREVAVLLLVDLSGSMSGEKAEHAELGSILLAETLQRLQTPFAVYGFQDVLIPFCEFGRGLDEETRGALVEMRLEVDGSRRNGHNQGAYNDDGPCLLEANQILMEQQATDHVLIVVSDGQPAGRRSDEGDLRTAISTIVTRGESSLVALGLGPDTEHVREYYKDAEANVPVDAFAERVGAVIERTLLG